MITRKQVEWIVAENPWNDRTRNSAGARVCFHCDFVEPDHASDCAWQLAKALLAAEAERDMWHVQYDMLMNSNPPYDVLRKMAEQLYGVLYDLVQVHRDDLAKAREVLAKAREVLGRPTQ